MTIKEFLKYEATESKGLVKDTTGNERSQFLKLEERLRVAVPRNCRDEDSWESRMRRYQVQ